MVCFFKDHCIDINQFNGFSDAIKSLQIAFASKNFEDSKLSYKTCSSRCELIKQEFGKFSNICSERLEICKHWRDVLTLISLLKGCVAAVRQGNGEAYFHTMQRLLPFSCVSGSIYDMIWYASWYLEKMRKLSEEYPQIYKHFQKAKCLVKTNVGYFKSVALDMKLQESKEYLIFRKEWYCY